MKELIISLILIMVFFTIKLMENEGISQILNYLT